MCPVCITTTVVWVAAGAGSTGGLTALVARTLRRKRAAKPVATETNHELRDDAIVARQIHNQGASK
jgi:hypothetical protein